MASPEVFLSTHIHLWTVIAFPSFIFPFSFVAINNPDDYEQENIVFKANVRIPSLNNYILLYSVENTEAALSDYSKFFQPSMT